MTTSTFTPLASCPPTAFMPSRHVTPRVLTASYEVFEAMARGLSDYGQRTLAGCVTPFEAAADALAWWTAVTNRRTPTWSNPHEIVFETPIARLRDFSQGSQDAVVPTLVLPPQAGHDSCIVDYSQAQSQIMVIRAAGLTRAYSLDWVGATEATKDASIQDYLDVLARAIEHIGGPVNLIGDCQGGWLATIYAALHPEQVHTLTLAGAPIDMHAGDAAIDDYVRHFSDGGDMAFFEWLVGSGGGVLKGELMVAGFIAMKPDDEISRQLELLGRMGDPDYVARYAAFEDWFKHTQDIPGAFYLWIVKHLFRDNELVRGELEIGGERVDLSRISCPVNLLAGANDHITPPAQLFALADAVSTPPEQIVKRIASGGHLGLFMGSKALREDWPPVLANVHAVSTRAARS